MSYPIKLSFKSEIVPVLTIIASFVLGFYFYAHFPDQVASHWGLQGSPNGYMGKFGGAFMMPFILTGIYLLFLALPAIDPRSERYSEFAKAFHFFKAAILLMLLLIYVATGLYNLGFNVNVNVVTPLVIGLLMIGLGNFMGKLKKNWFIGIRTPWTLSSENVWNKTHRFGGWMFVIFGLLLMLTPFLPKALGIAAFMVGVILAALVTTVYSYLLYRKEKHNTI